MKSLYLFGFSLLGGVTALFGAAGWSSFKHKKVPEHAVLFRWFVAGLVMFGLGAYVWLFGANGDVSHFMNQMNALDLSTFTKLASVTTLIGASVSSNQNTDMNEDTNTHQVQQEQSDTAELTVGMPAF